MSQYRYLTNEDKNEIAVEVARKFFAKNVMNLDCYEDVEQEARLFAFADSDKFEQYRARFGNYDAESERMILHKVVWAEVKASFYRTIQNAKKVKYLPVEEAGTDVDPRGNVLDTVADNRDEGYWENIARLTIVAGEVLNTMTEKYRSAISEVLRIALDPAFKTHVTKRCSLVINRSELQDVAHKHGVYYKNLEKAIDEYFARCRQAENSTK